MSLVLSKFSANTALCRMAPMMVALDVVASLISATPWSAGATISEEKSPSSVALEE